jgi:hypothetical protein
VHLEGLSSSLGAFVMVGRAVHFLESDGNFKFTAPSGAFDIIIQAPGHIPVLIPNAQVSPGGALTVPELTLPFGDANGDGKIDILDLSVAANNFGETSQEVTLPQRTKDASPRPVGHPSPSGMERGRGRGPSFV